MTVEEAITQFEDLPAANARLQVLSHFGIAYLKLGQPDTSLSSSKAQRVKLAKELGRRTDRPTHPEQAALTPWAVHQQILENNPVLKEYGLIHYGGDKWIYLSTQILKLISIKDLASG